MTNITKLACAFVLAGGLATPAFAASPGAANNDQNTSNSQSAMTTDQNAQAGQQQTTNPMHISQKLRGDLSKAGFTDITIMPSSFMVRAKDSQGNPVMMVINPDFDHRDHGTKPGNQRGQQRQSRQWPDENQ